MSNMIALNSKTICMSNGLTDVLIDVLVLSGSRLAQTVDEKRLIVWLAEKDQSKVGIGTVGFDIREIPWNITRFEENRQFMLKTVELAQNRTDWDKLDYTPDEDMLFPVLQEFSKMISKLNAECVLPNALGEWISAADKDDPVLCGFPRCEKHGVLRSCFGCHICNN